MVRLRTVYPGSRGWTRRRAGKGFTYLDETGAKLPPDQVLWIKSLVIPPAWEDVWICPVPNGHIQAVGIDAAGRKQYLYHPRWRARRDAEKFDDMVQFAHALPDLRERVEDDLERHGIHDALDPPLRALGGVVEQHLAVARERHM